MGTKCSHTGLEQMLGSRAADVLESATVPVLIIPEKWLFKKVNKIGFAFEIGEIRNPRRLELLNEIAKSLDASILGFTVQQDAEPVAAKDQKLFRQFTEYFDEGVASLRAIESKSVLAGIKEFSEVQKLDMIALIPKEHNFLDRIFKKSISKNLIIDASIPILAFRD